MTAPRSLTVGGQELVGGHLVGQGAQGGRPVGAQHSALDAAVGGVGLQRDQAVAHQRAHRMRERRDLDRQPLRQRLQRGRAALAGGGQAPAATT